MPRAKGGLQEDHQCLHVNKSAAGMSAVCNRFGICRIFRRSLEKTCWLRYQAQQSEAKRLVLAHLKAFRPATHMLPVQVSRLLLIRVNPRDWQGIAEQWHGPLLVPCKVPAPGRPAGHRRCALPGSLTRAPKKVLWRAHAWDGSLLHTPHL